MKFTNYGHHLNLMLVFCLSLLYGCSSSKVNKDDRDEKKSDELVKEVVEKDFKIQTNNIYSWINLMPGSEPRFNITGDINLVASAEKDYSKVILNRISVIQENKTIFQIIPTVREGEWNENEGRDFIFSTIKGILLTPDFDREKKIDIELRFTDGQNTYTFKIINNKVEKVY